MIEAVVRIQPDGSAKPYSQQDSEAMRSFKPYQPVRIKATSMAGKKERSYRQLCLYFQLCQVVADNSSDPNWNDKDKVDHMIRMELKWIKGYVVTPKGYVSIMVKSISFAELGHLEACNYFDRAFEVMAKRLGITVDELMANKDVG